MSQEGRRRAFDTLGSALGSALRSSDAEVRDGTRQMLGAMEVPLAQGETSSLTSDIESIRL